MNRFLWRLSIVWKTKSLAAWKHTRWLDHRPPTPQDIEAGQQLARELGLTEGE